MASLDDASTSHVVPATAAHQLAAVDAARRPVTQPAVSTERPGATVWLAEVGRLAQVDEVGVARRLELFVPRHQLTTCSTNQLLLHLHSRTEHTIYTTLYLSRRATERHLPCGITVSPVVHPTQVNVPRLSASQTSWYSSYLPGGRG